MSGFYRERDDEGPWCECCGRAICDDEEDWPDGLCPKCEDQYGEDKEGEISDVELKAEKYRDEAIQDAMREAHEREQRRVKNDLFRWIVWVGP